MRKSLCEQKNCDECQHSWADHKETEEYYEECLVKECKCEEYLEK